MEENSYIRRQRFWKTVMLVILAVLLTFLLTSIYMSKNEPKSESNDSSKVSSILNAITGNKSELESAIETIEKTINSKYLNSYDKDKAIEAAIQGYVSSLGDPYTEYIPSDEMKEYTESIMGNFVGIGIYMVKNTEKNLIQVLAPIRESPAEKAGIQAGDFITSVDDKEYTADDMTEAANKIKGEEGTKVKLEILRGEQKLTFEIERQKINTNPVVEEVLNNTIGYLGISSFDEGVSKDFKSKYLDLKEKGITSLIIDLRDNGGGLVDEALEILDYIVPKNKEILITVDKNGKEEVSKTKQDVLIDMPIAVLINENTASASEITAGALKDLGEAEIVGKKSYGKGVIQQLLTLSNGGGLKVTVEEYYTPNRTKINEIGISPDVEVDLEIPASGIITNENDTQLKKTIEILTNKGK